MGYNRSPPAIRAAERLAGQGGLWCWVALYAGNRCSYTRGCAASAKASWKEVECLISKALRGV
jgi:hypothetical protein